MNPHPYRHCPTTTPSLSSKVMQLHDVIENFIRVTSTLDVVTNVTSTLASTIRVIHPSVLTSNTGCYILVDICVNLRQLILSLQKATVILCVFPLGLIHHDYFIGRVFAYCSAQDH